MALLGVGPARVAQRCPRGPFGFVFFVTILWALLNNLKDKTQRIETEVPFMFAIVTLAEVLRTVLGTEYREDRIPPRKAPSPWGSTPLQACVLSVIFWCVQGARKGALTQRE